MRSALPLHSKILLLAVLFFAFVTRLYRLHLPQIYIFDEVYHVVTAKLMARNDPRAFEWWNPAPEPDTAVDWLHPPLAKYTQALSMKTFGETGFAWRLSSAIFGVLVVAAVYRLTQELFARPELSLLAAFLASLDGLLLVQSRVAMNDIHVTFFILLTLIFYTKYKKTHHLPQLLLTGLFGGLAVSTKWSGVFALGIVGLFEGVTLVQMMLNGKLTNQKFKEIFIFIETRLLILVALPLVLYLLSYSQMFLQGKDWAHFRELHSQIWGYQTNLVAEHNYQSKPQQWFLSLRPVWYHVEYSDPEHIANIYAQGNPMLLWLGAGSALFTLFYLLYLLSLLLKKKLKPKKLQNYFPLLFVLISYLFVWTPWFFSPRIMFFYHYTPAVPLLCVILAYWLLQVKKVKVKKVELGEWVFLTALILTVANFVVFYPQWTGLKVPKVFADNVYYAIGSWK